MRLTNTKIQDLTYAKEGNTPQIYWDDSLPGFGVRVYKSLKKSFIVKYRVHGRQHLMTIAPCRLMNLDEARSRAKRCFVQVYDKQDPLIERHKKVLHFDELARAYIERHCPTKKAGFEDIRRINSFLLPAWKSRPVQSITRAEVSALHHKIGTMRDKGDMHGGRTTANRVREMVHCMFELGKDWGLIEDALPNPAARIKDYKETKRDRFLSADELERLGAAIQREPDVYIRSAFRLYLLTGLRKRELLNTKWADVDLRAQTLRAATKNGTTAYQPLNALAVEIIRQIPVKTANPYVFPGLIKGHQLVEIRKPWLRIRADAGLEDVTIHDLRRTVGSWLAQSGHSLLLIGKVLNQTTEQATAVYAHLINQNSRDALESHGEKMREFIG